MLRRLRAWLRQALAVHLPDPADAWRLIYEAGAFRRGDGSSGDKPLLARKGLSGR